MSGGGSGGSGTQQYNWNDTMKPLWEAALARGQDLSNTPYQPYQYQRIADQTPDQLWAMQATRDWASRGGTGAGIAANNQAEKTAGGDYLSGPEANPYANASNPYMGYGPMFQQQLQGQLQDITNAYKMGTDADTTRMFNQAGAFGGSAYNNAVGANQAALGKTLGNTVANAYQTQFGRSGDLAEQQLQRSNADYEGERGRMIGALGAGQNSNTQYMQGVQQLMATGDANRSYNQDLLNQFYNDWQTQRQYPYTQEDYFTGLLGRAQGGLSPNVASQTSGYAASPYSQLLGGGLLAYGALH